VAPNCFEIANLERLKFRAEREEGEVGGAESNGGEGG